MKEFLPKAIYLAETTVQILAAYACLLEKGVEGGLIIFNRSHTYGNDGVEELLDAGRLRFPDARIVEYSPHASEPVKAEYGGIMSLCRNWRATQNTKASIVEALRSHLGLSETKIRKYVKEVYFTYTHNYVLCFLTICPNSSFINYPHGFAEPRRHAVDRWPYLFRKRSLQTLITTLPSQFRDFGIGAIMRGFLGRLVGRQNLLLPFPGVDRVITFRTEVTMPHNRISRVTTLEETFRWFLGGPPWMEALDRARGSSSGSLIVLLPECDRNPLWEWNTNFGLSHANLIKALARKFPTSRIVIKQHIRSDGSAAIWLCQYLACALPSIQVSILPDTLNRIPIEALALLGDYSAASSIGSVSLPTGLGFGIPHYFHKEAANLFDKGWIEPFWVNYENACELLAADGIGIFV